ncbi:flagellar biosynthesis protein FlgJ [Dissulfurirhabdus thermomarina]|uniref:Flagellar biosynthesis protein FlgJ n=1 Tax=Dissulfurirhabdus thermomarina TaxID=1765737 RepID=A0A6N9TUT3_DISTH|nr:rod-binding protein [Dissulfurirhabdus thermomarina]NDY42266.1 flagellar biosynthesis protein FlgJ [Dissulfurirhabdus thermomarina]NMX22771.1 flagellar biosynthesis protein FlgJ [Dissulfurirhabdus thermomarina]
MMPSFITAPDAISLTEARSVDRTARGLRREDRRDPEALRAACRDFEAVFLRQLLKAMRKTVPKSGLLDGGFREELYRGLLDEEFARRMAEGGGIGLGRELFRQLAHREGAGADGGPETP